MASLEGPTRIPSAQTSCATVREQRNGSTRRQLGNRSFPTQKLHHLLCRGPPLVIIQSAQQPDFQDPNRLLHVQNRTHPPVHQLVLLIALMLPPRQIQQVRLARAGPPPPPTRHHLQHEYPEIEDVRGLTHRRLEPPRLSRVEDEPVVTQHGSEAHVEENAAGLHVLVSELLRVEVTQ